MCFLLVCIIQVVLLLSFFFFQAEDGIRDFHVTGVQTCALPISPCLRWRECRWSRWPGTAFDHTRREARRLRTGAASLESPYHHCERVHLRCLRGARGVTLEVCGECRQHASAGVTGPPLRTRENRARRADAIHSQTARALELIEIRARDDEARGPGEALLILHVLICELHELRGVDLVLGEHRAGLQLEYI